MEAEVKFYLSPISTPMANEKVAKKILKMTKKCN